MGPRPSIKEIPTQSGLPDDYHQLSKEGQRMARVNGCRQWLLQGDSTQRAANLIKSLWLFDSIYLMPSEDHDPGFYDMTPLPTPQMHWQLTAMWAVNRCSVSVMPRGSAKSTHGWKDSLLRLISCPAYSFVQSTSSNDNAKRTGQVLMDQCYGNERIQEDWGPEYNTTSLRPTRGEKMAGIHWFYLRNNSWSRQVSVESRLRGLRPRRFRLDDPEFDEKGATSMEMIRYYMARLLFKIIVPMVTRRDCGVDWTATFVSKRHYAWSAMETFLDPKTGLHLSIDPRFNFWARMIIPAAYNDPDTGHLVSCWQEMWPETIEVRKSLKLYDAMSLEEIRLVVGEASFRSEYMADPGSAADSFFKLCEIPEGPQAVHAWWIKNADSYYLNNEYAQSNALFCYLNKEGQLTETPISQFLRETRRFALVDTAYTESATSDRRAVTVVALTPKNELFALDMWSDRKKDSVLMERSFRLCAQWLCPLIYVEVVKNSFHLYQRFLEAVRTRYAEDLGISTPIAVRDLRPGMTAKSDKIAALDTRFENNLIKLPLFQRTTNASVNRLIDQIVSFNPNENGGGLQHDDEIDTIAMSLFVMKGALRRFADGQSDDDEQDPLVLLAKGETKDQFGRAIAHGLNLSDIPMDTVNMLMNKPSKGTGRPSRV